MNPPVADGGQIVADHWGLLVGIMGGAAALLGLLKVGRALVRSEINEGILLSLDNGAGKRVTEIVKTAVQEAMDAHPINARVNAQHDRLLEIERAVLAIVAKSKE